MRTKTIFTFSLFLFLFLIVSTSSIISQVDNEPKFEKNTIYIGFATVGSYYSINYDRIFYQIKTIKMSGQLGFSIFDDVIAFPLGINFFSRKGVSHLEIGLTIMPYINQYKTIFRSNDLSDKYLYLMPHVGYRYQKPQGGFFFKASISPVLILDPPSNDFWNMGFKYSFSANLGAGISF